LPLPLTTSALWLLAVAVAVALLLPIVAAIDVQRTSGAGAIEAHFPAQTAAAAAASAANAAASGYPSRPLAPLRGAVVRESVSFLAQAAAAFKASKRIDIVLDNEDVSSDDTKSKFLDKGTSHAARRWGKQKPHT
jgi:hypothetical protein